VFFFCGEDFQIILNTTLTKKAKNDVESLHGKVIGMSPCDQCKKLMEQGIILIGIDNDKSDRNWYESTLPNPYRTGEFVVIKDSAFKLLTNDQGILDFGISNRFMFIEHEVITKLMLDIGEY
jgi:hypothetical protein